VVTAGEFVLGYLNEFGHYPSTPVVPADPTHQLPPADGGIAGFDLGRNGTYLVMRQLKQDVQKFWQTLRALGGSDEGMIALAAKMVGRWPSGAPLVTSPGCDIAGLETYNGFGYASDPFGFSCPLGAHARRANPRDALPTASDPDQAVRITKRHRIIRRGRPYGPPLDPDLDPHRMSRAADDDVSRGLHFLCLGADIERQFEFIQHSWLNDPKFGGLYGGPDPLFSDRIGVEDQQEGPDGQRFVTYYRAFFVQADPVRRRWTGLSPFVTVRGGGYFFMPGLQALRYLASPLT
jgi:deferrochelatase/peroxidase EfeB